MAVLKLNNITEAEWHKRKKDAGIASAGLFAKADQRNNIGPAIKAYHSARQAVLANPSESAYKKVLHSQLNLAKAIQALIGGDGVKGNRELTSPKAQQLAKELKEIHDDLVIEGRQTDKLVKNPAELQKVIDAAKPGADARQREYLKKELPFFG